MERKFDVEDRFIEFASQVIIFTDGMKNSKAGNYMSGQLLRNGTSPALNYGEAQSRESMKDFFHKIKIILKELRESRIALRIIEKFSLHEELEIIHRLKNECNQLYPFL